MLRISDAQLQKTNRSYRNDTNRVYRPALLGDNDGVIPDPQLPGNVLVRTLGSNGLSVGRSIAIGDDLTITYEPNTPVRIGKDRQRRDAAIGADNRGYLAAGVNPVAIWQRSQSSSTPTGNIEMFRCIQSSPPSLTVAVRSWNPIVSGLVYLFGGGTLDLTAAVPSTDEMCYAVVGLQSNYSTLEYATSTPRDVSDVPLDAADIQEAIDALSFNTTPCWAIKLIGDQTTITQANIDNDGQDLRNFVNVSETTSGGWTQACRVYNNADEVIPNGTFTVVTFNSERYDTDTMHDTGSNTGRITFTTAGVYHVHAQIVWDVPGSTGLYFQIEIRLNGSTVIANTSLQSANTNGYLRAEVSTDYYFSAADYVEILGSQNSGGNFNVKVLANFSPEFMAHRVA